MSRTKRRDRIDNRKKVGDSAFGESVYHNEPTEEELLKAHMDGKKWYKPHKKFKKTLGRGNKEEIRRTLDKVIENPDEAPLPRIVKTHQWDWL